MSSESRPRRVWLGAIPPGNPTLRGWEFRLDRRLEIGTIRRPFQWQASLGVDGPFGPVDGATAVMIVQTARPGSGPGTQDIADHLKTFGIFRHGGLVPCKRVPNWDLW
jgi:hypothetical protein